MRFIQTIGWSPLNITLYTEEDIDFFNKNAGENTMVCDATCGVAAVVDVKRVFYFGFMLYDKSVVTEPVPVLQVLTDAPDEQSLTSSLQMFGRDQYRKYPKHQVKPIVTICDMSWPLIKSLLMVFNRLTLPEYINLCFKIVSGFAEKHDFLQNLYFMVILLCLAHIMKLFGYYSRKYLKAGPRNKFMFFASVLCCVVLCDGYYPSISHTISLGWDLQG